MILEKYTKSLLDVKRTRNKIFEKINNSTKNTAQKFNEARTQGFIAGADICGIWRVARISTNPEVGHIRGIEDEM